MTIPEMRAALIKLYPSKVWKQQVKAMSDKQVFAIYQYKKQHNQL